MSFKVSPLSADAPEDPSAKVVHFVRHGQGHHNVAYLKTGSTEAYKDWAWVDSRLTPVGEGQAMALRTNDMWKAVELVIVSPLSRAIATSLLARPVDAVIPTICTELCRERIGTHPCDRRRTITELQADFPSVDFGLLNGVQDDPSWTEEREPWEDIVKRAMDLLELIAARPEKVVAVFTHCDFLDALFHDSPIIVSDDSMRKLTFNTGETHGFVVSRVAAETE